MKYRVKIRAIDGEHELTRRPVKRETAIAKAKEWLGDRYNEITEHRYVSAYGEVVTIEAEGEN
jgi:hypothetical protein